MIVMYESMCAPSSLPGVYARLECASTMPAFKTASGNLLQSPHVYVSRERTTTKPPLPAGSIMATWEKPFSGSQDEEIFSMLQVTDVNTAAQVPFENYNAQLLFHVLRDLWHARRTSLDAGIAKTKTCAKRKGPSQSHESKHCDDAETQSRESSPDLLPEFTTASKRPVVVLQSSPQRFRWY